MTEGIKPSAGGFVSGRSRKEVGGLGMPIFILGLSLGKILTGPDVKIVTGNSHWFC